MWSRSWWNSSRSSSKWLAVLEVVVVVGDRRRGDCRRRCGGGDGSVRFVAARVERHQRRAGHRYRSSPHRISLPAATSAVTAPSPLVGRSGCMPGCRCRGSSHRRERFRRAANCSAPAIAAPWCGRYCGNEFGQRLTRAALGSASMPRRFVELDVHLGQQVVVGEVQAPRPSRPSETRRTTWSGAGPVRPLLGGERDGRDQSLLRFRHEIPGQSP